MKAPLHVRELQHLQQQLDALETIKNNSFIRYKCLQQQKHKHYSNEYDRIHGELASTKLPATTKIELKKKTND